MARLLRLKSSIIFWILAAYFVVLTGHFIFRAVQSKDLDRETRGFYLQHALRVTKPLLRDGRTRELSAYLKEAIATGLIDFYELELKDKISERQGRTPSKRPVLTESISQVDGWIWGKAESATASLHLASGVGWRARVALAWSDEVARLPADLIFLLLTCSLSVFFHRKVHRQAARVASAGSAGGGERESKRSKLKRAERAREEIEHTEFEGVFGRSIFVKQAEVVGKLEGGAFFAAVEDFYTDCGLVLSRYSGKLHSVHGNELLFYFSDGEPRFQARMALAAARDLEQLAEKRGFALATTIAFGSLRGAHLKDGFALFGSPVEQTAELMQSLISQKRNAVWASDAVVRLTQPSARFDAQVMEGRKNLGYSLSGQGELLKVLSSCKQQKCADLAFHRSDDALVLVLRSLGEDEDWSREAFVATVNEIKQVQCRRFGHEVTEAFRKLLNIEMLRKDSHRLSATLAMAPFLLSRRTVDKGFEKIFFQAAALKDKRVRANAVELFTRIFPEREIPELRPLIKDDDCRVSANAIVKAACERFDEKVIARIEERLRVGSVGHVASALHAVGEIALYYRKHDPLFLGTKINFLRIFDNIPAWAQHPNPMIQRQALLAAHKLQSQVVDSRLQQLFGHASDPELLKLFASIYGWRKEEARAA